MSFAWFFNSMWLICNIIMALFIYSDMKRLNKINWWVLVITLINKEFGAIVALLHYFINEKESVNIHDNKIN